MVGPKYARPAVEQPAAFKSAIPGGDRATLPEDWWRLYGNSDLEALIATANAANQTIRQAVAHVDQARALARVAASYRYPTITFDPAFTRQRASGTRVSAVTGQPVAGAATYDDWNRPGRLELRGRRLGQSSAGIGGGQGAGCRRRR